jgi:hypothetical protein
MNIRQNRIEIIYIELLYKKLKLNLEREFYLSYNNPDIRRGFTKIRIRDLEIEKGGHFL